MFWILVIVGVTGLSYWYRLDERPVPLGTGLFFFLLLVVWVAEQERSIRRFTALSLETRGYPLKLVYELLLSLPDRAWNAIGLTPEEKALVTQDPPPYKVVVERWGSSLIRCRVFGEGDGRARERVIDMYGTRNPHVTFWELELPPPPGEIRGLGPAIAFSWRKGELLLGAYWGRFGGEYDDPLPEHTFFRLKVPLWTSGARGDDPLVEYLDSKRSELGCASYHFENAEKGFQWWLTIRDLRPHLYGKVVRVHRELWSRRVTGLTAKVWQGVTLRVAAEIIEWTDRERRLPRRGDSCELVLNEYLTVDRAWVY